MGGARQKWATGVLCRKAFHLCLFLGHPNNARNTNSVILDKEVFNRLDLGDDWTESLRQVIDGVVQDKLPDLKENDHVLVGHSSGYIKHRCHFKEWASNGRMITFSEGKSAWSTGTNERWEHWKLPEGDE